MNKWLDSTVNAYLNYFGPTKTPVVYEVGSRDGKDGFELAARIYDGVLEDVEEAATIVLFEPNPPQAEVIRSQYPSAILIEAAASDTEGRAKFVQINGDINDIGSSSLDMGRVDSKAGDKAIIEVDTVRLDTIFVQQNTAYVDVMKIDAEGYTYEILQGMGDYLATVKVLHLETEVKGIVTNKTNLEVFEYMRDHGFLCYAREHEWGEDIEDQVWVNAGLIRNA